MNDLPPYKTPRWVKVFGIAVIGLVLLVVVVLLVATALGLHDPSLGPGRHGPGDGTPSGDAGDDTLTYQTGRLNVGTFQRLNVLFEHGVQQL